MSLEKEPSPVSPHVVFNLMVLPLGLFFGTLPLEIQADLKNSEFNVANSAHVYIP